MSTATQERTAADLLEHLTDTGTGRDRLALIQGYLDDNEEASAEDLFAWMQEHLGIQQAAGTIRKAGKYLYGPTFDLPVPGMTSSDEVKDLRGKLDAAEKSIQELQGRNAILTKNNLQLKQRIDSLMVRDSQAPTQDERPKRGRNKQPVIMAGETGE